MQKVDKEKTRYYLAKIHILFRGNFRTQVAGIMRMAERDIVAKIRNYLKTVPHCFFWKEHGGKYGTAGIPDIIACIEGHFFGFEVKTDKGKPTVLQEATIRKILKSGGTAAVVRSVDEVRALIEGTLQRDKDTEKHCD